MARRQPQQAVSNILRNRFPARKGSVHFLCGQQLGIARATPGTSSGAVDGLSDAKLTSLRISVTLFEAILFLRAATLLGASADLPASEGGAVRKQYGQRQYRNGHKMN